MNLMDYLDLVLQELQITDLGWEKICVDMNGNLSYLGYSIKYFNKKKEIISCNEKHLSAQAIISIIKMHRAMEEHPKTYKKWNRAILVVTKDGKYEINFSWDQELQDSWDNA